ncbi:MAG: radical SAM protein, partial [Bacteriovoracia bacterium]
MISIIDQFPKLSWSTLKNEEIIFLEKLHHEFKFSFQELKQLIDITIDLWMWDEGRLSDLVLQIDDCEKPDKNQKKIWMGKLKQIYENLKTIPKDYNSFLKNNFQVEFNSFDMGVLETDHNLWGQCPVASEKTRCCNLYTLDAVQNCGFGCSYCCIQTFYHGNNIIFVKDLKSKLQKIKLDPAKRYHIGTGQGSDSLMWGNREGILEALLEFAARNSNVILELKTKSDNVKDLIDIGIPRNVITTWTLNTDTIIRAEEHKTANLNKRLTAARKVADAGAKVGFHFHPMVFYEN